MYHIYQILVGHFVCTIYLNCLYYGVPYFQLYFFEGRKVLENITVTTGLV